MRVDSGGAAPIDLPDLTEEAVVALSRDFVAALDTRHSDRSAWHQQVATTCMALWDLGVDRLVAQLSDVDAAVLVPTGLLTLLPLHAAMPAIEGGYALDTVRLTYAPNARLLLSGRHAGDTVVHDSVMVVDAPHRADLSPLPFSPIEARAAIGARPRCEHLHGKDATIPRVLDALARNDLLHFSCHAMADPTRAWASALLLADGPLTVERIRQTPPRHARLAFLSACETAVVSYALPDEVIAFPSVLLAAGIPGVIASLWPVPQAATALLVTAFYDELIRGVDLPDALRQAQRTVREATGSLISERLKLPWRSAPAPSSRPFSHPVFWAGFTFTGE